MSEAVQWTGEGAVEQPVVAQAIGTAELPQAFAVKEAVRLLSLTVWKGELPGKAL